jgi:transposase
MKRFVEGMDREQSTLFPECLEDWICEDNPARVIDVFVGGLDLAELRFCGVDPEATGRPSYHPSVLLKLYIYGYLNRVQSSRRLEREACRNVEVMWLAGRLVPDHKTIADFRKDNGPAIRKVCAQFVAVCREIGLLTQASVAIDGSKFKAVNNRDKNFTRAKMERRLAQIEESVARYLSQLDTADLQEPTEALAAKTARLKEKLAKLAIEMQRLKAIDKEMLASPDQQISLTDPDSRSMATSGRGSGVVGYNVQVAVDTEHHLIVTHEVTNTGSDRSQLAKVASRAKDIFGADHLDAVADRGYFNSPEILACEQAGITVTPSSSGAASCRPPRSYNDRPASRPPGSDRHPQSGDKRNPACRNGHPTSRPMSSASAARQHAKLSLASPVSLGRNVFTRPRPEADISPNWGCLLVEWVEYVSILLHSVSSPDRRARKASRCHDLASGLPLAQSTGKGFTS